MVNTAIIGLGYWGPNVLRALSMNKKCKVKYACDLLDSSIEKFKKAYPLINFTKNYLDIINEPGIELVCIATPPETHFELAKESLNHGKHVFIMKPMTTNSKDGQALIDLANDAGKLIMVDHTFIFSPPVRKIKELIDKGDIGKPLYFDSERINLGLLQERINVVWDLAPHDFSILTYCFQGLKPKYLFAVGSKHVHSRNEDMAHITIAYENELVAHVHVSWLSPVKMRKTIIGGTKKMILYDDVSVTEKIKVYERGIDVNFDEQTPFKPIYRSGDIWIPNLSSEEPLAAEVEHVLNCVRGKEKPIVDGKAGLAIVKLLEACDASISQNRKIDLDF